VETFSLFDLASYEQSIRGTSFFKKAWAFYDAYYQGLDQKPGFFSEKTYDNPLIRRELLRGVRKRELDFFLKRMGVSILTLFQGALELTILKMTGKSDFAYMNVYDGRISAELENTQGVLAKAFDMYGVYERRELRMGNQTSIALTAGAESYALDKNKKTAKRTKDADLNFLNLNETLMKKLKLQKKGTATVMGKQCDHYVGTNVEYYVWKGLVMKKVQKNSDGTITTHEVTSIEEPTSVDPKMFKMPDGYTVSNR
jgi:hypothetical protein